jgi:peroxiredoxin family protein
MKYAHIGWCREGTSDKVWGAICLSEAEYYYGKNKYVTFWGRRGAKLQTKIVEADTWSMSDMFRKKTNKGYKEVEKDELDEVYPEFQQDLEKTAFWATLKL